MSMLINGLIKWREEKMGQPRSWVTTGKGDERPNGWRLGREQQRGKQIFPAEHPEDDKPTVGFDFPCVLNSIDWAHSITLWWKCLHVSDDCELSAHLLESIQPHLFRFIKVWQNKMSQRNLWLRLSHTHLENQFRYLWTQSEWEECACQVHTYFHNAHPRGCCVLQNAKRVL